MLEASYTNFFFTSCGQTHILDDHQAASKPSLRGLEGLALGKKKCKNPGSVCDEKYKPCCEGFFCTTSEYGWMRPTCVEIEQRRNLVEDLTEDNRATGERGLLALESACIGLNFSCEGGGACCEGFTCTENPFGKFCK